MDVFSGNKHLESKLLHLSDSLVRFEYPYREAYGNGLGITFAFVRKGIVYEQEVSLTKRLPDYTLNISWDVFRDHWRRDYADSNYFYFGFRQRSLKVPSFSYDHFVLPPVGYAVAEVLSITNDAAPVTRYARMRGMGAMKQQIRNDFCFTRRGGCKSGRPFGSE